MDGGGQEGMARECPGRGLNSLASRVREEERPANDSDHRLPRRGVGGEHPRHRAGSEAGKLPEEERVVVLVHAVKGARPQIVARGAALGGPVLAWAYATGNADGKEKGAGGKEGGDSGSL